MIIGVPKETKEHEYRVGLTPESVKALTVLNHQVIVEQNAGFNSGFTDEQYLNSGAVLVESAIEVFAQASLIIKVKEPLAHERKLLNSQHILFTYLHLAPDLVQTRGLMKSQAVCIAYETVTNEQGALPLLSPMSAVAGRMAIQAGAQALEKVNGGRGILLSGVDNVPAANVVIIGGGIVGKNAAQMAIKLGANVTLLDKNKQVLQQLHSYFEEYFHQSIRTVHATAKSIEQEIAQADLIIGAVLIPGAAAPKVLKSEHLNMMKAGAALVDVAIDQGGCFATSKPTTHQHPTFIVNNIVHYCVTNMPSAVPKTATLALNFATLPFIIEIANQGYQKALLNNHHLRNGLNIHQGHVTCQQVALNLGFNYVEPLQALQIDNI